jgi:hypothetical protein
MTTAICRNTLSGATSPVRSWCVSTRKDAAYFNNFPGILGKVRNRDLDDFIRILDGNADHVSH